MGHTAKPSLRVVAWGTAAAGEGTWPREVTAKYRSSQSSVDELLRARAAARLSQPTGSSPPKLYILHHPTHLSYTISTYRFYIIPICRSSSIQPTLPTPSQPTHPTPSQSTDPPPSNPHHPNIQVLLHLIHKVQCHPSLKVLHHPNLRFSSIQPTGLTPPQPTGPSPSNPQVLHHPNLDVHLHSAYTSYITQTAGPTSS